jgi:hypothetical protein
MEDEEKTCTNWCNLCQHIQIAILMALVSVVNYETRIYKNKKLPKISY